MTRQQNIAMAQQKFVIQIDSKTLQRVKPFDRAELVECMLKLFSGFSWVNWTNGHSLGRAWQTALSQCGAFCDTKNDKNPAAKYLKAAAKGYKKYWSQIIMTHKNRENTLNQKDQEVKKLYEHGKRMIRTAIDQINLILARYNEYTLDISMSQQAQQESATQTQVTQNQAKSVLHSASESAPQPMRAVPMSAAAVQPAQQQMAATSEQKETPQAQKMATAIPVREAVAKPAVKTVELPQGAKAVAKKTYVAPTVTIKQNAQRRPYEKPTVSVRDNPFAKQSVGQTAKFVQAQIQLQRQINIITIRNMNQRAA